MVKVGINGFGRIGRVLTRVLLQQKNIEVVAINELANNISIAHLLKYDSVHGKLENEILPVENGILIDEKFVEVFSFKNPTEIPWKKHQVDIVIECTGKFKTYKKAEAHLLAGAKKVIISAPAQDPDKTVVYGVNHLDLSDEDRVISNASCTTNCLAPLAKVIHDKYEINTGLVNTVHASTNDQSLLDVAHSDLYRARAASSSIIPSKTGAAKAIGLVIPELNGKLNGMATRVPTLNVSMLDFTFETTKDFEIEELINEIRNASESSLKGILSVSDLPLVSIDFNHNAASSIFDTNHIYKIGKQTKILAWYDNEWGFSKRMVDLSLYIEKISSISFKETA